MLLGPADGPDGSDGWAPARDALEGPQKLPQKRLDRRLEEVAKAVAGSCCRLQMPLKLALGVRGTEMGIPPPPLRKHGLV